MEYNNRKPTKKNVGPRKRRVGIMEMNLMCCLLMANLRRIQTVMEMTILMYKSLVPNISSKMRTMVVVKRMSREILAIFCETCEEEFESRNKLHKHLSGSGHAAMKF